ncbi:MAG: hypothetical protein EXX96DRAFT_543101 [Benjaminiella poitrasii]|nr:MAG: hypothetical protein EXX96DRAFT_543875 [Benjaminiella poitrasii]KAI9468861.1 MAG: hypothetical protein EXX96DRAFT_543552 [Benjaminiella poitrasii]KAI9471059.1 MAG: hypothetical protein EXX96DRAFT_543101 [Benjaminiella poitrasii]
MNKNEYEKQLENILGPEYYKKLLEERTTCHKNPKQTQRRRLYKKYTEVEVQQLLKCYFVDGMSIVEASKACNFSKSSGARYIKKFKENNTGHEDELFIQFSRLHLTE